MSQFDSDDEDESYHESFVTIEKIFVIFFLVVVVMGFLTLFFFGPTPH